MKGRQINNGGMDEWVDGREFRFELKSAYCNKPHTLNKPCCLWLCLLASVLDGVIYSLKIAYLRCKLRGIKISHREHAT